MKSLNKSKKIEKGQLLPLVALAMVALITMAALIIDGAMIMSHRRTAQAAADAAALAGAEWLCPHNYDWDKAESKADDYVELNHAEVVEISPSTEFENTIHVETKVESDTFFSGILGQVGLIAEAEADASCSATSTGASTLPLVYPCEDINPDPDIVECAKKYYNFGLSAEENMTARNYTIIHDSTAQIEYCDQEGVNCDDIVSSGAKGWVALDRCGKKQDLEGWVSGIDPTPEISVGFWLPSLSGLNNNDMDMLKDYLNRDYLVPIYDSHCENIDPRKYCDTLFLEDDNDSICVAEFDSEGNKCPSNALGQDSYRVAGFGLFHMTCVQTGWKDDCPYRKHLFETVGIDFFDTGNSSLVTVEGYFIEGTYPVGGGDGADAGLYTVHLRR
jgi:hypothetical protein